MILKNKKSKIKNILLLVVVSIMFIATIHSSLANQRMFEISTLSNEDVEVSFNESHVRFQTSYLDKSIEHVDFFVPDELQKHLRMITPCDPNLMYCQGYFNVLFDWTKSDSDTFWIMTDYIFDYEKPSTPTGDVKKYEVYDPWRGNAVLYNVGDVIEYDDRYFKVLRQLFNYNGIPPSPSGFYEEVEYKSEEPKDILSNREVPRGFGWQRINQEVLIEKTRENRNNDIMSFRKNNIEYIVNQRGHDVVITYLYYDDEDLVARYRRVIEADKVPVIDERFEPYEIIFQPIPERDSFITTSLYWFDGEEFTDKITDLFIIDNGNEFKFGAWHNLSDSNWERYKYKFISDMPIVKYGGIYTFTTASSTAVMLDVSDICTDRLVDVEIETITTTINETETITYNQTNEDWRNPGCEYVLRREVETINDELKTFHILEVVFNSTNFIDPTYTIIDLDETYSAVYDKDINKFDNTVILNYGNLTTMWFDGVDDGVNLQNPAIPLTGDFEITWKAVVPDGWVSASNRFMISQHLTADNGRFVLGALGSTGQSYLFVGGNTIMGVTVNDGIPREYRVTRTGNVFELFVDGVSQGTTTSSSQISNTHTSIGTTPDINRFFEGSVWDVNINNQHFYKGYGNTDAHWVDQIGSNHGTVIGNPVSYFPNAEAPFKDLMAHYTFDYDTQKTLPLDISSSDMMGAWSLRNLKFDYEGDVVRVRRSSDDSIRNFNAEEIINGTLVDWVKEPNIFNPDLSSTFWAKENVVIIPNQEDPNGNNTAFFMQSGAVDDIHQVQLGGNGLFSWTQDTFYEVSFYTKKKDYDFVYLHLSSTNPLGGARIFSFNLVTEEVKIFSTVTEVTFPSPNYARMVDVGNGWYRVEVGFLVADGGTGRSRIGMTNTEPANSNDNTFQGDGESGNYFWMPKNTIATANVHTLYDQRINTVDSYSFFNGGGISDIPVTTFNTGNFDITGYIKSNEATSNSRFLAFGSSVFQRIIIDDSNQRIIVDIGGSTDGVSRAIFDTELNLNQLYKIRILNNNGVISLWKDDVLVGTVTLSGQNPTEVSSIAVGRRAQDLTTPFFGIIYGIELNGVDYISGRGNNPEHWNGGVVTQNVRTTIDYKLARDLTQSTNNAQPFIVQNGQIVTENGKPILDFDGTNDHLRIPDAQMPTPTDKLMVSAVVKNNEEFTSSNEYIFGQYDFGTNDRIFALHFRDTGEIAVNFGDPSDGTYAGRYESSSPVSINTVKTIGFTYDAGTVKLYVNGEEVAGSVTFGSIPSSLFDSDVDWTIGSALNSNSATNLWNGQIGEVIFSDNLDDDIIEIQKNQLKYFDIGINNLVARDNTANFHGIYNNVRVVDNCKYQYCVDTTDGYINIPTMTTIPKYYTFWKHNGSQWDFYAENDGVLYKNAELNSWRKMYFDGVDDHIELPISVQASVEGASRIDFEFDIFQSGTGFQSIFSLPIAGASLGFDVTINGGAIRFGGRSLPSETFRTFAHPQAISTTSITRVRGYIDYTNNEIGIKYNDEAYETSSVNFNTPTFTRSSTGTSHIGERYGTDFPFEGFLTNLKLYADEVLIHQWYGNGNTNADWVDQIGSSDGVVMGNPDLDSSSINPVSIVNGSVTIGADSDNLIDDVMFFRSPLTEQNMIDIYNENINRYSHEGSITFPSFKFSPTDRHAMIKYQRTVHPNTSIEWEIQSWNESSGYNRSLFDGLVYHAPFDNNFNVYQSNNNMVVTTPIGSPTLVDGVYNNGVFFNISNTEYIDLGSNMVLANAPAITHATWYKIDALPTGSDIYYLWGIPVGNLQRVGGITAIGSSDIFISSRSSTSDSSTRFLITPNTYVNLGEWQHIVSVIDFENSVIKLYIDGVLIDTSSNLDYASPFFDPDFVANEFRIGMSPVMDTSRLFNGTMDDTMLFNRALSHDEVKELYVRGLNNWKTEDIEISSECTRCEFDIQAGRERLLLTATLRSEAII